MRSRFEAQRLGGLVLGQEMHRQVRCCVSQAIADVEKAQLAEQPPTEGDVSKYLARGAFCNLCGYVHRLLGRTPKGFYSASTGRFGEA